MTATTTVPVHPNDKNFLSNILNAAWTIVGVVAGVAVTIAVMFAFRFIEINDRVVETTNADGDTVRRTIGDTAFGWSGMVGFFLPLLAFALYGVHLLVERRIKSESRRALVNLILVVIMAVAVAIAWVNLHDNIEWKLILLGLAGAAAIIIVITLNVRFYLARERKIKHQAWGESDARWRSYATLLESELVAAGVNLDDVWAKTL